MGWVKIILFLFRNTGFCQCFICYPLKGVTLLKLGLILIRVRGIIKEVGGDGKPSGASSWRLPIIQAPCLQLPGVYPHSTIQELHTIQTLTSTMIAYCKSKIANHMSTCNDSAVYWLIISSCNALQFILWGSMRRDNTENERPWSVISLPVQSQPCPLSPQSTPANAIRVEAHCRPNIFIALHSLSVSCLDQPLNPEVCLVQLFSMVQCNTLQCIRKCQIAVGGG